jgi:predicted alpha-1,2-mannosidase
MRILNLNYLFVILFMGCANLNSQSLAKFVDTKMGSEGGGLGCGFNFIGASYPFGMVQFTPSFFSPQKGFVINQLSGAGCPHMGNVPVLPVAGNIEKSPDNMEGFDPYKIINEAHAGFLSVSMKDKTEASLTVNKRSGIAKFKFDKNNKTGSVIIGAGISSTFTENAMIKITSNKTCEGFADGGDFCGTKTPYKIYFAVAFDREASTKGTWIGNALLKESLQGYGKNSGAYFTFDTKENAEINYRISVSFVSIKNAKENLKSSKIEGGFEAYKSNAEKVWNENLSKIAIESLNLDRKVQFYTHLYHALIHPNLVSDVNGDYMGADFQVHKTKTKAQYSSFSVWDTYRTQAQLLAMLYPKESGDMMQSLVDFADQSGGYGRWILANIETGIMQGDPTSILIANSYAFGATNFDIKQAYKHMKRGATIPLLRSQNQEIRPHLTEYLRDGHTFASMMLEYTSADFAIGQFALQALDNKSDGDYFINRAQNWKNIYNPKINWLNSKHPNGEWKDIEHDWREATYKNYFWMVPYNLKGLIDTIGGKQVAEKRLNTLFNRLDASYEEDWFAAGNEPDFQVPWIYNWTSTPYKTSEVIHRIFKDAYNSKPNGLPGNDDLGTMGAWYVYASIGLYPMIPGIGGFSINAPQFKKVTISFPEGQLVINGGSTTSHYIQSLKWNNKNYTNTWLDWETIKKGGLLDFKTSNKPQKSWGKNQIPPSYN